ncbi:MAG: hypothetical protein EOO43_04980 [Flavobacterium sp.]|nr:MAG: hypothetical protein EOO43_04980 [Flavobacterium sp.]
MFHTSHIGLLGVFCACNYDTNTARLAILGVSGLALSIGYGVSIAADILIIQQFPQFNYPSLTDLKILIT